MWAFKKNWVWFRHLQADEILAKLWKKYKFQSVVLPQKY